VTLTDLRSEGAVVDAKAFLEGELLADCEIVFAHLDNTRANQIFGPKNFVFTQQLLGVLDLAKAQQRAKELDGSTVGGEVNGEPPAAAPAPSP
jgi:3-hydroxyacyl-[acyl-carrier-protein] dehydratase